MYLRVKTEIGTRVWLYGDLQTTRIVEGKVGSHVELGNDGLQVAEWVPW